MKKDFNTDDFLAKWASDELSAADKETFEKSEDYKYYKVILEGTDVLEVPPYDKEKVFEGITNTKAEKTKVVPLFPKWTLSVAASLVVLLGLWFAFNTGNTKHKTDFGEQLTLKLPDNSEVILNARSSISYNKKDWKNKRTLSLVGHAYFKVEKGSSFTVETNTGQVQVLGTKFSVHDDDSIFEVICFEGMVSVKSDEVVKTITNGEAIRVIEENWEGWNTKDEFPGWLQSRSTFKNAPLQRVITAIEKQYNVSIDATAIAEDQRFTGSFTHDDLEVALRTICESMEIKFIFKDENTIVLVDK